LYGFVAVFFGLASQGLFGIDNILSSYLIVLQDTMETDNQPQIKQEVKIEDGSAENANPGQKRKGKWENKWKKQVSISI
jgi:hypothetical protein